MPAPIPSRAESDFSLRRLPLAPALTGLLLALLGCLILGALVGDQPLAPTAVARAIVHPWLPFVPPADEITAGIVVELRLPRLLLAALVGAMLSAAGATLQSLLLNPLADPYTIGVSSGAAVGAALALTLGIASLWGGVALSGLAFLTALLALGLVFALARVGGRLHTAAFLLAGVVVGSFLWSLTTLLLSLAGQEQGSLLRFLMGRFSEAQWHQVLLLTPLALAGVGYLTLNARSLDAFAFGEDLARSVGVEVERFKGIALTLCALLTAAAVSVSGIIGFIGLVVPHLSRSLTGAPHRALIPVSALLGAILTLLADLLARVLRPGEELPVGVITAILGAPFFLALLRRMASHQE